MLYTATAV